MSIDCQIQSDGEGFHLFWWWLPLLVMTSLLILRVYFAFSHYKVNLKPIRRLQPHAVKWAIHVNSCSVISLALWLFSPVLHAFHRNCCHCCDDLLKAAMGSWGMANFSQYALF